MSRTKTIYLSDKIRELTKENESNFSGRLTVVADRYLEIIKSESTLGKFTDTEIKMIVENLKSLPLDKTGMIKFIPNLVDSCVKTLERDSLIEKLKSLSFTQLVALAENIELLILQGKS